MRWEELLDQGRNDEAVEAILSKVELTATDNFHIGQCYAYDGRHTRAKEYFLQAYRGEKSWDAYVDCTIAFLEQEHGIIKSRRQDIIHNDLRRVVDSMLVPNIVNISYQDFYGGL